MHFTDYEAAFPSARTAVGDATIRSRAEDFIVHEVLPMSFTGHGEHWWLWVEKAGQNTEWVAGQLARIVGVPRRAVSTAGLKDRNAVTRQWFSVQLPSVREAALVQSQLPEGVRLLESHWHHKKLRTGQHSGNRFALTLREYTGSAEALEAAFADVCARGVPNYFGPQRFGHGLQNLHRVERWFKGELAVRKRAQRGLLISSARSWLFNGVLAERVRKNLWDCALDGDVLQLDGTRSWFVENPDAEIHARIKAQDLHPTGPLYGTSDPACSGAVKEMEEAVCAAQPHWLEGLRAQRAQTARRALRAPVRDAALSWHDAHTPLLQFTLPPGAYATAVLHELVRLSDASLAAAEGT